MTILPHHLTSLFRRKRALRFGSNQMKPQMPCHFQRIWTWCVATSCQPHKATSTESSTAVCHNGWPCSHLNLNSPVLTEEGIICFLGSNQRQPPDTTISSCCVASLTWPLECYDIFPTTSFWSPIIVVHNGWLASIPSHH